MELKYVNLYAVEDELCTWEGLDTFKINKNKIEYLYIEAPKLKIGDNLYLVKDNDSQRAELVKYEGYGRYTSLGSIETDTLEKFIEI